MHCKAEVNKFDFGGVLVDQKHILRFDVSMHHVMIMAVY